MVTRPRTTMTTRALAPWLLSPLLAVMLGCGEQAEAVDAAGFEGVWTGAVALFDAGGEQTASAAGVIVGIRAAGDRTLVLNEVATARATSATAFEALAGAFPTIYGPGYQGPGGGTTTITGGTGRLTADGELTLTVERTAAELDGSAVQTRAVYTMRRAEAPSPGRSL
jgi:hypothetical protein